MNPVIPCCGSNPVIPGCGLEPRRTGCGSNPVIPGCGVEPRHTLLRGLAKWASPLSCAGTCESVHTITASAAVQTGTAGTFVDVLLTVHSLPARVTDADVPRS